MYALAFRERPSGDPRGGPRPPERPARFGMRGPLRGRPRCDSVQRRDQSSCPPSKAKTPLGVRRGLVGCGVVVRPGPELPVSRASFDLVSSYKEEPGTSVAPRRSVWATRPAMRDRSCIGPPTRHMHSRQGIPHNAGRIRDSVAQVSVSVRDAIATELWLPATTRCQRPDALQPSGSQSGAAFGGATSVMSSFGFSGPRRRRRVPASSQTPWRPCLAGSPS